MSRPPSSETVGPNDERSSGPREVLTYHYGGGPAVQRSVQKAILVLRLEHSQPSNCLTIYRLRRDMRHLVALVPPRGLEPLFLP